HNFPLDKLNGAVRFTCVVDGSVYFKHGTTFDTRLTVIDKSLETASLPDSPRAKNPTNLLSHGSSHVSPQTEASGEIGFGPAAKPAVARKVAPIARRPQPIISAVPDAVELTYEPIEWKPAEGADLTDALYEGYALQSIHIPGAKPHPTKLVQSAAMASVAPPHPSYRPHLPVHIIKSGILSEGRKSVV